MHLLFEPPGKLIPGWGRCLGGGHGNPLKCYCLENPHGQRGAWWVTELDITEQLSTAKYGAFWLDSSNFSGASQ